MLTKFSLWLLHAASYGIAYFFLAAEIVIQGMMDIQDAELNTIETITSVASSNSIILSLLYALFLFSVIYTLSIKKWRNNSRIGFIVTNEDTYQMGGILVTNIVPLITIGFNIYVTIIVFALIWILGIAVVRGGYIYTCPVFLLIGYHLYSDNQGRHVLSKMKKEKFNLYIRENVNGIEAREIYKNIYIVCDQ